MEQLFYEFAPEEDLHFNLELSEFASQLGQAEGTVFKADMYQATIAAIVVSKHKPFLLMTLPTGSGKTFIICLLAHYFVKQ